MWEGRRASGVNSYRRPNPQGSEPIESTKKKTVINDSAYTPFAEHYQVNGGYSDYYEGNISVSPVFLAQRPRRHRSAEQTMRRKREQRLRLPLSGLHRHIRRPRARRGRERVLRVGRNERMKSIPPPVLTLWMPALLAVGLFLFLSGLPPEYWVVWIPLLPVLGFMSTLAEIHYVDGRVCIKRWWGSTSVSTADVEQVGSSVLEGIGCLRVRRPVLPWGESILFRSGLHSTGRIPLSRRRTAGFANGVLFLARFATGLIRA